MSSDRGLHAAAGQEASADAHDRYIGRWSRLAVPSLLAAAEVGSGDRVLVVPTGTGEAAVAAISLVGDAGVVVGADISAAMLGAAHTRLPPSYRAIVTDGQALAFRGRQLRCRGVPAWPDVLSRAGTRGGRISMRPPERPMRGSMCQLDTGQSANVGPLACALGRQLPEQRNAFQLSFSWGDARRLEQMFVAAGFHDVRVEREKRNGIIGSFDEYWDAIEAGTGQMPFAYLTLAEAQREVVREEVAAALLPFMSKGRLEMSVEMLIGVGRA